MAGQGTFQMSHAELQAGLGRDDLTADLWQLGRNTSIFNSYSELGTDVSTAVGSHSKSQGSIGGS
jgi:hypothetical protein